MILAASEASYKESVSFRRSSLGLILGVLLVTFVLCGEETLAKSPGKIAYKDKDAELVVHKGIDPSIPRMRVDAGSFAAGILPSNWTPEANPERPISVTEVEHHPEWIKGKNEWLQKREVEDECSHECQCKNGGLGTPYGRYCSIFYSSCTEAMPYDGLDFCCSYHDYCVGVNGYTSCLCNSLLYACSKNIYGSILLGYESSPCRYEEVTTNNIMVDTMLNPLCNTPSSDSLLRYSYTLYVRWPPGNHDLLFDFTAPSRLYNDWVGLYPLGACQETWNCELWNTTVVQRTAYGRIYIPASEIVAAVPYSGYYELRYIIVQPSYYYWVATSNSFYVYKN